jgi:hypothetical protein
MKKIESTVTKTTSVINKLKLPRERIRVLTSTDLELVEGGTSCGTHDCTGCKTVTAAPELT